MKKLLLLLLTLLAFAPPGAKAQSSKTINILTTNGVAYTVTGTDSKNVVVNSKPLSEITNFPVKEVTKTVYILYLV